MLENQELYCHACKGYVQFKLDMELDGKHTLNCPNCGHEHFRFVEKGKITDKRWKSSGAVGNPGPPMTGPPQTIPSAPPLFSPNYSQPQTYQVSSYNTTYSAVSTFTSYGGTTTATDIDTAGFFHDSWSTTSY